MTEGWIQIFLSDVREKILVHRWIVQGVGGLDDKPGFAYTVGLWPHAGYELLVLGLPSETAQWLLNTLAAQVMDLGDHFVHGQRFTDLLAGEYQLMVIDVTDSAHWVSVANAYYQTDDIKAKQIIFQDNAHRWPWDDGYAITAPVLGDTEGVR